MIIKRGTKVRLRVGEVYRNLTQGVTYSVKYTTASHEEDGRVLVSIIGDDGSAVNVFFRRLVLAKGGFPAWL